MRKKECPSCAIEVIEPAATCPVCGYEFPRERRGATWVVVVLILILILILIFLLYMLW
jgi:uncharacterized integral membrane protein